MSMGFTTMGVFTAMGTTVQADGCSAGFDVKGRGGYGDGRRRSKVGRRSAGGGGGCW